MSKMTPISDIIKTLERLEDKARRFSTQIGYESSQTLKTLKNLLNLSTSLSIVFLHYNLLPLSSRILKQALTIDIAIFFKGKKKDKKSPTRVILYCNLAYLLLKLGDLPSSLKFLYDSESLLLELKEHGSFTDLKLASSIIGFISMCRLGKVSAAHDYLNTATENFNNIIREGKKSKYSQEYCSDLYSLLTFAGEILQNPKAFNNFPLFSYEVLGKVGKEKNNANVFLENIIKNEGCLNGLEVLCLDSLADFFYLVAFFPLISKNTPMVSVEEIRREKMKSKRMNDYSGMQSPRKKGTDNYSYLMKCALQKFNS